MTPPPPSLSQLVDQLPTPLALVLHEYLRDEGDYVRLHRICSALEVLCRFLTAMAVADLRRRLEGKSFPEPLVASLSQHLARPTLASWRVLLESSTAALARIGSPAMSELLAFSAQLARRMGAGRDDPLQRLLPMRNELAHAGRLSEGRVQELCAAHRGPFEKLLGDLRFLAATQCIALVSEGEALQLRGTPPPDGFAAVDPSPLTGAPPLRLPRLYLKTPAATLDLCPLHWYGDVLQAVDERLEAVGEAASQLYSRRVDGGGIELTALGSRLSVSRATADLDDEFDHVFPIDKWESQKRLAGDLAEFDFSERMRSLTSLFVGRTRQLEAAATLIDSLDDGVVWIAGKPGMGKSAFVARLVRDRYTDRSDIVAVPYFFVAAESTRCRVDALLKAAILHLLAAAGSTGRPAPPDQRLPQLRTLVESVYRATGRRTILFLDAIDEVAAVDSSWASLIFEDPLPHTVWVCTGRDEADLTETFAPQRCHWLFPPDGLLPPLTSDDIRGFFIEDLGHRLPQLFQRDQPHPHAKGRNPFVEKVLARSQGLPLYLRLLVDQLRCGSIDFGPASERRLPEGLINYYDNLLDHPDLKSALWSVLALLSQARDALSFAVLRDALRHHPLLKQPQGERCLRDALRLGHVMLKQVVLADGQPAYELFHHSFREHLNRSERFSLHAQAAREWLADYCLGQYQQGPEAMSYYARDYLPAHLFETERTSDLHQALVDPRLNYIETWIREGNLAEATRCLTRVVGFLKDRRGPEIELAALLTALARICTRRSRYDSAQRWLKQVLARTSWLNGRRVRAIALHELGTLCFYAGDRPGATKYYRAALRLARWGIPGLGEPAELADEISANLVALASLERDRNRHHQTIALAEQAQRAARRAGDLRHLTAAGSLRADALAKLLRLDEAQRQMAETENDCRTHELPRELGNLLLLRGWLEYSLATLQLRIPTESAATFEEALAQHQRAGYVFGLLDAQLALAACAVARRDLTLAAAIYQETQPHLPPDRHLSLHLDHQLGNVTLAHCQGRLDEALSGYRDVAERSIAAEKDRLAAQARVGEGACHWHLGSPQSAEPIWEQARTLGRRASPLILEVVQASIKLCRADPTVPPR